MDTLTMVLSGVQLLFGVVLVIIIMLQSGKSSGLSSVVTGSAGESFFGKNKRNTLEAKLERDRKSTRLNSSH